MRRSRLGEIQDRFPQRFIKRGPDECWDWIGTMHGSGYGVIQGKLFGEPAGKLLSHRAAWIIENKTFPDGAPTGSHGWVVMHTCDNRKCVNPAHLRLGSQADNVADMDAKQRDKRTGILPRSGVAHHKAVLTAEQVAEVVFSGLPDAELAEHYGVSAGTVKRVRLGATYKRESGGAKLERPRFSASGEKNPGAKLTYEQVKYIRESPKTTRAIAAELGLSQPTVASARRGATYKDVDVPIPVINTGRPKRPKD